MMTRVIIHDHKVFVLEFNKNKQFAVIVGCRVRYYKTYNRALSAAEKNDTVVHRRYNFYSD